MKIRHRKLGLLFVSFGFALAGCQGAPCGNCGACGTNYGQFNQPYGQVPAMQAAPPGVVTPPPGTMIQPGVQYPAGTVPVAPQQLPPGSIYGGG